MGVPVDNVTLEEATNLACQLIERGGTHRVVTPNGEIAYRAIHDPTMMEALNGADLSLPDGVAVVLAAKLVRVPLKGKTAGVDFGAALLEEAANRRWSVYFLGGKPGVAQQAAQRMEEKYPGLLVAGAADGYFDDPKAAAERIRKNEAVIVYVCLGVPKQELWMAQYGEATGARLLCGLGGSIDIYAGTASRAPKLWVKLGLEWFYRLLREPRRLGRMLCIPRFLASALGEGLRMRISQKKFRKP
jgi:N-acetylglucosaminyldiphosphoundecaprenol N-acetyl-beta-D-mannosaminyltransferase